ncbi:hypothetical protein ECC02_000819 [Trypanosoma cruzi]|uniref:Uncharacterized protein n=1 Tax=Trypanosoma cruzi TaxID=5693 RepID=A0A7J6YHV4_TRYCR|nr:hypothetical protein ECC02_000819 [Trypanosoma cruzi]
MKHPTRTAQLRPAGAAGSKGQSRLFRPAVPMALGVALARRGGRCAMQPHCNACRRNSQVPPPPQQHNVQSATTPPHYRPFLFYYFIYFVCPFALSPTLVMSVQLHKRIKGKHNPTVPMQLNTLLHPPPLPHRRPQSHRRVNTTMRTTPSCSERWARRGHASPRSIFPSLKSSVPAQSSKQNQSANKPNHPPHSMKHIIRME